MIPRLLSRELARNSTCYTQPLAKLRPLTPPSLLSRVATARPLLLTSRPLSTTRPSFNSEAPPNKTPIGQIDRRLQITFTCTAPVPVPSPAGADGAEHHKPCGHRSSHEFSRRSYEKGIVLIECPSCMNRHLIADNLDWFSSTPSPGHPDGLSARKSRTIEDLMREKGEEVKWAHGGEQGSTWEVEG
ncbi:zf-DNL-domain-containing protein [Meredithblackwellia eburnea MCA 4105]